MDSNAVVLDLLHHGIISRGDQRTITRTEDPTEQNKFLHLYLKEKCTEDAFHLVCDIISGVKGNPKMSALSAAMKLRLATGNCVCVCVCVRVCACKNYWCIITNVLVNGSGNNLSAMLDSQSQHSQKPQDGDVGSIDVGCRQSVVNVEYSGDSFSL